MKRTQVIILFLLILFAVSCVPRIYTETGKKFNVSKYNDITPAKTTKSDIIATFGQPEQTGIKESGKEMWTYLFLSLNFPPRCLFTTTPPQIEHQFMRMTVTFDNGVVHEKSYEISAEKEKESAK